MKKNISIIFTLATMLVFILAGCQQRKPLKEFTFSYSMESENNYKVSVTFDSKKHFKIEKYNYFMDNMDQMKRPFVYDSTLSEQEYKDLHELLEKTNFAKMKDSYGFNQKDNGLDLIHQVKFTADGQQKFITIKSVKMKELPKSFTRVLAFINKFLIVHNPDKLKSQVAVEPLVAAKDSAKVDSTKTK